MSSDAEQRVASLLTVLALVVFAAMAPLLPPTDLKVDATLLAAVIMLAAAYVRVRTGGSLGRTAIDLPALCFLAAAIVATIFSVDPFLSFMPSRRLGEGLLISVAYVGLLLAAARLTSREVRILLVVVVASGALIGAIGTAQAFGVEPLGWFGFRVVPQAQFYGLQPLGAPVGPQGLYPGRSTATIGNPIFLGGYAALLLPLVIVLALQTRGRQGWGYGAASVLLFGALIGSQARAAWAAALVALLLVLVLLRRSPHLWRRLVVLAILCALVGGAIVLRQQASMARHLGPTFTGADSSLQFRLYLWKHTLAMIAQRPVTGWGFSTMLGRFADLGSPEYFRLFGFQVLGIDSPHNDLLSMAFNTGLLGLLGYLWIWITLARSLRRSLHAAQAANPRLDVGLAASLLAYAFWVQLAWTQVGPAQVFWTFGGIAVALGAEATARVGGV